MSVMFASENASCRSALWRSFAGHVVLPWALQGLEPNGRLLELGSGSAAMAAGTAARYPGVHVTATDTDPEVVRAAATRLAPYRNATAEQADVVRLPFADASFDVVTSFLMLHHVGDWRRGIEQAYRVLRPGGTFVGYDFTDAFVARAIHLTDHTPHQLLHRGDLLDALEAAGFTRPVVSYGCGRQLMRFITVKPALPTRQDPAGVPRDTMSLVSGTWTGPSSAWWYRP